MGLRVGIGELAYAGLELGVPRLRAVVVARLAGLAMEILVVRAEG